MINCFNPRPPRERRFRAHLDVCPAGVPIHAPCVGAARCLSLSHLGRPVPIHAPKHGAMHDRGEFSALGEFQSTLTRRERRVSKQPWPFARQFQSTLSHGERRFLATAVDASHVLQSTLPHRKRCLGFSKPFSSALLQSTLAQSKRLLVVRTACFNPCPGGRAVA